VNTALARPRILLADDHSDFLESVRDRLSEAFEIVGGARNGREALDLARSLRPDLVVLDVAMPDLTGFQTLERLRRDDPAIRVVFLTMHQDDDFVTAGIRAGAMGYVLKSRMYLDLIGAIRHALAGRLFVPSLTSLSTVAGNGHTVHFHSSDNDLLDQISQLADATLRSGEPLVLVTSEATITGVAERLRARQVDLAALAAQGRYVARDSSPALAYLFPNGRLDRERVAEMVHGLDVLRLASANGPGRRLTVVGDLSVSLCRDGAFDAALELERLWNELTGALPFLTICCHPVDAFERPDAGNSLRNVCAEHSAVTSGVSPRFSRDLM
jgi:DNA-binding NarL/FixJ family response regulator